MEDMGLWVRALSGFQHSVNAHEHSPADVDHLICRVCDDPDYFYAFMQNILDELGATQDAVGAMSPGRRCSGSKHAALSAACVLAGASIQDMITVRQAKGAGYAMSRTQELVYMQQIAQDTGKHCMRCALH